jgi:hypothetical protein
MVPPYGDVDVAARVERERLDRLAQWLEATIGPRLTAYAAGTTPEEIQHVAHGDEDVDDALDRRLRNLYALTWFIAATDGPGSAHEWLLEPNPELGSRPPAQLLHDGQPPEQVWLAAGPTF